MLIPESLLLSQVEHRALSYLLQNHKLINELKPQGYFFNKAFAEIYHALYSLKDVSISNELLLSRLKVEYHPQLKELKPLADYNEENFNSDISLLKENSYLIRLWQANEDINLKIPSLDRESAFDAIRDWRQMLDRLEKHSAAIHEGSLVRLDSTLDTFFADTKWRAENPNVLLGYPTGIKAVDDYTLGLIPTNLAVCAGRPGAGKTAFLVTVIRNFILRREPKPFIFFSLEMSKQEIIQRLMASLARIKFQRLRVGVLSKEEWLRLVWAKSLVDGSNVWIDDTAGISIDYIEDKISDIKDISLLGLDYLQLVSAKAENKRLEVGKVSNSCKRIAKTKNVAFLALAQLNRLTERDANNRRPVLNNLRECVTGDTLLQLESGTIKPIRDVEVNDKVLSLDVSTLQTKFSRVADIWSTGKKEVFLIKTQTGNEIKATANHPFLTIDGWKKVEELNIGSRISTLKSNSLNESNTLDTKALDLCRFIGYMCGNGTMQKNRGVGCITADSVVKDDIVSIVNKYFPNITIRTKSAKKCTIPVWDMYFSHLYDNGYGKPSGNDLINWLSNIGMIGLRDRTKHIPEFVLSCGIEGYKQFISGYLATDGTVSRKKKSNELTIKFASISKNMLQQIKLMLMNIGIVSMLDNGQLGKKAKHLCYTLTISTDLENSKKFCRLITVKGKKQRLLNEILAAENSEKSNGGNLFVLPNSLGVEVEDKYGYRVYRHNNRNMKLTTCARIAKQCNDSYLQTLADSDVLWEKIISIEKLSELEETFDIRIDETHNFVGNGFITHNSGELEQDADLVLMLYRDKYYDANTPYGDLAEIIIAKQRNGPTGTIFSLFLDEYVSFENVALV